MHGTHGINEATATNGRWLSTPRAKAAGKYATEHASDLAVRIVSNLEDLGQAAGQVFVHRPRSIGTRLVDWCEGGRARQDSSSVQVVRSKALQSSVLDRLEASQQAGRAVKTRLRKTVFDIDQSLLAMCDSKEAPDAANPRIWWRHPVCRLINVSLVIFLDFFMYCEDPVQASFVNYPYFGVFEDLFMLTWPANPIFRATRIILFVIVSVLGVLFGRLVIHHWLLRDRLGLTMFAHGKGAFLIEVLSWISFFEYVLPIPVNLIESGTLSEPITEDSVLLYYDWGRIWQSTAAAFDLVSVVMITDTVLQDRTVWPEWGQRVKWLWNDACHGIVRIVVAWAVFVVLLPLLIYGLYKTGGPNGVYESHIVTSKTLGFIPGMGVATTQWQRLAIAAVLTIFDIMTCLQDWEFPSFNTPMDFKIAGTWSSAISCSCLPWLLRPISKITCIPHSFWDHFHFSMSGKWVAYLPAVGALAVDWWYLCRTIFSYSPEQVGEYERPSDCAIFVIKDRAVLEEAYHRGVLISEKLPMVTWEARQGMDGDAIINSRYCDNPILSCFFLVVGFLAGIMFLVLIIRAEHYWDRFLQRHSHEHAQDALEDRVMGYLQELTGMTDGNGTESSSSSSSAESSELST